MTLKFLAAVCGYVGRTPKVRSRVYPVLNRQDGHSATAKEAPEEHSAAGPDVSGDFLTAHLENCSYVLERRNVSMLGVCSLCFLGSRETRPGEGDGRRDSSSL